MKRIILTESEKKSLLNMHISKGYKTLQEQEEIIVNDFDDNWDYKKVGDEYFTKKKNSDKWIKATGTALNAIKTKVKFEPKSDSEKAADDKDTKTSTSTDTDTTKTSTSTDTDTTKTSTSTDTNTKKTSTSTDTNTKKTSGESDNSNKEKITCDNIINAIRNKRPEDTSLLNPRQWQKYFSTNIKDYAKGCTSKKDKSFGCALTRTYDAIKNNKIALYEFREPINLDIKYQSNYSYIPEGECDCVTLRYGIIGNYDLNITGDDDIKKENTRVDYPLIRIPDGYVKKCE